MAQQHKGPIGGKFCQNKGLEGQNGLKISHFSAKKMLFLTRKGQL